ncbi:hypothetical protein [Frondihabitans sp. PAMC 28766]|uniref:hypothetical protein n=1 Tax=Frondihabitans sp. PAMC 28766 TaxID=1795630 RepID=UPI0019519209|nr:hypothetical protein [Frondihabitans sp. PAMC 28766]
MPNTAEVRGTSKPSFCSATCCCTLLTSRSITARPPTVRRPAASSHDSVARVYSFECPFPRVWALADMRDQ